MISDGEDASSFTGKQCVPHHHPASPNSRISHHWEGEGEESKAAAAEFVGK